MPETIDAIADDFRTLLAAETDEILEVQGAWTFEDMLGLTELTYQLFRGLWDYSPERAAALQTSVGRLVAGYMATDPLSAFPNRSHLHNLNRCPGAEKTLIQSVSDEVVDDTRARSPVIVTSDEAVVGVIKSRGLRYIYGLDSEPEHNIVPMTFSAPLELYGQTDFPPRADHAWRIEAAALEPIVPLRLSCFAIAASQRPSIQTFTGGRLFTQDEWAKQMDETDHSDIQAQVEKLLEDAIPLPQPQTR